MLFYIIQCYTNEQIPLGRSSAIVGGQLAEGSAKLRAKLLRPSLLKALLASALSPTADLLSRQDYNTYI